MMGDGGDVSDMQVNLQDWKIHFNGVLLFLFILLIETP